MCGFLALAPLASPKQHLAKKTFRDPDLAPDPMNSWGFERRVVGLNGLGGLWADLDRNR